MDMTGFGNSPPMDRPYNLDDYASEIKRVIDELGVEKADVIAHSFGARVLVKLLKSEKRIDKVVLTGAAGLKPRVRIKYFIKSTAFNILKRFIKREKLRRFYSADYLALSPVMRESFKLIISEDLTTEYAEIGRKTLLVFGKKDKETPLSAAKRMKRLVKGSRLIVLPREGHFCFSENPAAFNGAVFSFLMEK